MRLNKLFLLGVYAVSVSLMGPAPIIGAELDEPWFKSHKGTQTATVIHTNG